MSSTDEAAALWRRASESLKAAEVLVDVDPNSAASRAYYAAFHAVSALFALEGSSFGKHKELRGAVHRDLVHAGRWSTERGKAFDYLSAQRDLGDYGTTRMVSKDEAAQCAAYARAILDAVEENCPELSGEQ